MVRTAGIPFDSFVASSYVQKNYGGQARQASLPTVSKINKLI
jgi:hypothetical protein